MVEPVISVDQGKLRGKTVNVDDGFTYYSFQGIPYAKPPIGELRFKAPEPPLPWNGILDATNEGSECYARHMIFQQHVGDEDCLFLNIYTPDIPKGNIDILKPVMVWIHGGGFTSGSNKTELYGPEFLIVQDVVLVTINYRLGILGFLSLEDSSLGVPGNAGMKDMVMALKWVQKNISKFLGDPNNVTIFGESAGGAAVHYLTLSPMTKGLFHKAIIQSGSVLCCWARGTKNAHTIAEVLGLETRDEKEILKHLRQLPVEKILDIQEKIPDPFRVNKIRPHGPVVEKPSTEPGFLLEEPIDIITSGKYNAVPLLIGYNNKEGMLLEMIIKRKGPMTVITDFEESIPYTLKLAPGSDDSKKIARLIKEFYYGNEEPSLDNIDKYDDLETDNFFFRAIYSTVKNQVNTSTTPIYLYRFSVDAALNIYKRFGNIERPGACHADEIGYIFKTAFTPVPEPGSLEDATIKRMTKLWTTFARNSDPNPIPSDPLINVVWKPVNKENMFYLDIGEKLNTGANPAAERMAFWDKIYATSLATSKL